MGAIAHETGIDSHCRRHPECKRGNLAAVFLDVNAECKAFLAPLGMTAIRIARCLGRMEVRFARCLMTPPKRGSSRLAVRCLDA